MPDPRTAPIESLIPGLEEIIDTEGPILDLRVYRLFASSAGIKRLREPTKERLTQGLDAAIRYGSVEESFELGCRVLRKKGRPKVVLRTRGTRDLREIPPSEVQQMMRFVMDRAPGLEGEQVFREVISRFEVGRLTESARGFLQKVYASLEEDLAESRGDNYSGFETSGAADLVRFPSGEPIDQLRVVLQPYRSWEAQTLTDPRTAATDEVIRGLVEIISVEGPMLPYRAYQILARSAGIARVRQTLRERFDECLDRAVAIGKIVDEWQMTERVVRLPEVPSVILRERGPRTFHEIPPCEVAELVTQIQKSGIRQGRTELYGNVREYLKLGRLSTRIRESLDAVLDSLDSSEERATDA
ncbi:hypothetical protein MYX84_15710 [Acidobacteria bacterium AH-259-O06]|nr:hypothetical protein [Acidobacteria bacterium AH-259-O06]